MRGKLIKSPRIVLWGAEVWMATATIAIYVVDEGYENNTQLQHGDNLGPGGARTRVELKKVEARGLVGCGDGVCRDRGGLLGATAVLFVRVTHF